MHGDERWRSSVRDDVSTVPREGSERDYHKDQPTRRRSYKRDKRDRSPVASSYREHEGHNERHTSRRELEAYERRGERTQLYNSRSSPPGSPTEDARRRSQSAHRKPSHLPSRPPPNAHDRDSSIDASSFSEYRRLKRLKLAEDTQFLIWERSPSPQHEPLLATDSPEGAATAPVAPKLDPTPSDIADPELAGLDADELKLFMEWLSNKRQHAEAEAEIQRKIEEENRLVGPTLPSTSDAGVVQGSYGGNLRPGEGERMAAFAKSGERIPRRGEVGLSSNEISEYEKIGYVMSGNRHSRMNAIRMRKENQVYTAEEKAALALFHAEEARRKEDKLIVEMKKLVDETVGGLNDESAAVEEGGEASEDGADGA